MMFLLSKFFNSSTLAINFDLFADAKTRMSSYPDFSKLTFNFGMSTTYEKHLFVGITNPSDIAPTSRMLSQIISISFPLFGSFKYNLSSRFQKISKQQYRMMPAIIALNTYLANKNLAHPFFN